MLEGAIHETERETAMIKHFINYTGVLTLDFPEHGEIDFYCF